MPSTIVRDHAQGDLGYMSEWASKAWARLQDADYSSEEIEFMMAVEKYKTKHSRRFPTCCEILAVAKSLGYRKMETVDKLGG